MYEECPICGCMIGIFDSYCPECGSTITHLEDEDLFDEDSLELPEKEATNGH